MASEERYGSAKRLHRVKQLLTARGALSRDEIADELEVTPRTVSRVLASLQDAGEPLYEETRDGKKYWKLLPSAQASTVRITLSQAVSLFLSRRVFDFLRGTGFQEDMDALFDELLATLHKQHSPLVENLEKKLFDVNEHPHVYGDTAEKIDDIVTALLYQQPLRCIHASMARSGPFVLEPYTLTVFKKGLYLVGRVASSGKVRTFALDGFGEIERASGERFEYPAGYAPAQQFEGAFGIIKGPLADVVIRFRKSKLKYLTRRIWHATQALCDDGEHHVRLTMRVAGTLELESWILSWGANAEALSPPELREKIAKDVARMWEKYQRPVDGPAGSTAGA